MKLLGLARRAGAVAAGVDAARRAVRDGGAKLLLAADDASPTQLDKVLPSAERSGVPIRVRWSRARLGRALGRAPVSAVAVMDDGFAEQILLQLPGPKADRGDEK